MSNAIDALGSLWGPLLVLGQIGLFTLVLLISIAFLLLLDRKIWAGVMMRKGPNVVGPFGLLQSFADFGKFLLKEIVIPAGANKFVFIQKLNSAFDGLSAFLSATRSHNSEVNISRDGTHSPTTG